MQPLPIQQVTVCAKAVTMKNGAERAWELCKYGDDGTVLFHHCWLRICLGKVSRGGLDGGNPPTGHLPEMVSI